VAVVVLVETVKPNLELVDQVAAVALETSSKLAAQETRHQQARHKETTAEMVTAIINTQAAAAVALVPSVPTEQREWLETAATDQAIPIRVLR
jgi:hypothetical protein